jgi:hypothetical protein
MHANEANDEKQPGKRSAFTIMSNVRDHCEQLDRAKKLLMLTLATYCNRDGICYPSNETLVKATRIPERTIRRKLSELKAEGELQVLTPGIGRDKKRIISLKRYTAKPAKAVTAKPAKAMTVLNRPRSLGKRRGTDNDNCHEQPSDGTALGNSTPTLSANRVTKSEKRFGKDYQNQNQPAQNHVKWPEFAAWCRSKGGQPREDGFWKWMCGQKPQWRDKRRPDFDEQGFLLDGKFFPQHEAIAMMVKNPELHTRFKRAIKRDGKVQPCA